MKGCLLVIGFLAAAAAGVYVLLVVVLPDPAPATATREVTGQVTGSEEDIDGRFTNSSGHQVSYTYVAGGRTWASQDFLPDDVWSPPSDSVRICVDPDDPALHRLPTRQGARCSERVVGILDEHRAEPADR